MVFCPRKTGAQCREGWDWPPTGLCLPVAFVSSHTMHQLCSPLLSDFCMVRWGQTETQAPTVCHGSLIFLELLLHRAVPRPRGGHQNECLMYEDILMKALEGRSFLCSQLKVQSVLMGSQDGRVGKDPTSISVITMMPKDPLPPGQLQPCQVDNTTIAPSLQRFR